MEVDRSNTRSRKLSKNGKQRSSLSNNSDSSGDSESSENYSSSGDSNANSSNTRCLHVVPSSNPEEDPPDVHGQEKRLKGLSDLKDQSPEREKSASQPRYRSPIEHLQMKAASKRSEDELSIGPEDKDMYEEEDVQKKSEQRKLSRPEAYSDSDDESYGSDDSHSWRTDRVKTVLQSRIHKPSEKQLHRRSPSYERENFKSEGRFRSVVGTTIKHSSHPASPQSVEIADEKLEGRRYGNKDFEVMRGIKAEAISSDRHRYQHLERGSRSHKRDTENSADEDDDYKEAERNFRKRRFRRIQDESPRWGGSRQRDKDGGKSKKLHPGEGQPALKRKKKDNHDTPLQNKTGGAYIPPAKLKMMQEQIADKSSTAYQRLAWEALKKSINGLINKTNVSNIKNIIEELLQLNIVRGRGLLSRSIIQAQTASPTFTHVYAALVGIINCKFPQNGELMLKRLIINFKKGFRRNDKVLCLASARFIAHLVNQQVAHEVIALEILTLLLENPSDDSVEIAVGFLKECGLKMSEVTPRGINAIFERLRSILHEGQIDQRVQYMVEVIFANRKDGFKDFPSIQDGLDLVEESEQYTHLLSLEETYVPEDKLNIFIEDPVYLDNEERYKVIRKEILGEESTDSSSDDSDDESSSQDEDSEDPEQEAASMEIIDQTETNMIALRRTIYLTIQSSLDFEECAHKMLKMQFKPGQEKEVCLMILDCCAQQRTYEKFFGLLAQRFCQLKREYVQQYETIFPEQYETCHRLDTNKLRNVAKFFAHLFHTDAISWTVLSSIKMNEDDTTSSSRIFVKIMFQELSEYMGLPKMNERLRDPTLQPYFYGLLPRDNPANTRFAINFFTTIGLGGLTDDLREHLKNYQKVIMQQQRPVQSDSSSSDDSSSESSESLDSSDSNYSSDSSDSNYSSDSSDSSSGNEEDTVLTKHESRTRKHVGKCVPRECSGRKDKYHENSSREQRTVQHGHSEHRGNEKNYSLHAQLDRKGNNKGRYAHN